MTGSRGGRVAVSLCTFIAPLPIERAGDLGAGLYRTKQCEGRGAGDGVVIQRFETGGYAPTGVASLCVEIHHQLPESRMVAIFLLEPGDPHRVARQGSLDHLGGRAWDHRISASRSSLRGLDQLVDIRATVGRDEFRLACLLLAEQIDHGAEDKPDDDGRSFHVVALIFTVWMATGK